MFWSTQESITAEWHPTSPRVKLHLISILADSKVAEGLDAPEFIDLADQTLTFLSKDWEAYAEVLGTLSTPEPDEENEDGDDYPDVGGYA